MYWTFHEGYVNWNTSQLGPEYKTQQQSRGKTASRSPNIIMLCTGWKFEEKQIIRCEA